MVTVHGVGAIWFSSALAETGLGDAGRGNRPSCLSPIPGGPQVGGVADARLMLALRHFYQRDGRTRFHCSHALSKSGADLAASRVLRNRMLSSGRGKFGTWPVASPGAPAGRGAIRRSAQEVNGVCCDR